MITIQSTGQDPGMEIIHWVWPGEEPFQTPAPVLVQELRSRLEAGFPERDFSIDSESHSFFRYSLHVMPNEVTENIGASTTACGVECGGLRRPNRRMIESPTRCPTALTSAQPPRWSPATAGYGSSTSRSWYSGASEPTTGPKLSSRITRISRVTFVRICGVR